MVCTSVHLYCIWYIYCMTCSAARIVAMSPYESSACPCPFFNAPSFLQVTCRWACRSCRRFWKQQIDSLADWRNVFRKSSPSIVRSIKHKFVNLRLRIFSNGTTGIYNYMKTTLFIEQLNVRVREVYGSGIFESTSVLYFESVFGLTTECMYIANRRVQTVWECINGVSVYMYTYIYIYIYIYI